MLSRKSGIYNGKIIEFVLLSEKTSILRGPSGRHAAMGKDNGDREALGAGTRDDYPVPPLRLRFVQAGVGGG